MDNWITRSNVSLGLVHRIQAHHNSPVLGQDSFLGQEWALEGWMESWERSDKLNHAITFFI